MIETWKPIVGFEGLYEVSDFGRVLSCRKGKIMRQRLDGRGYYQVNLWDGSKKITAKVHKLVANTFLGPVPPMQEVRHGQQGSMVNHLVNLSYGTSSENSMDRHRDGTVATRPLVDSNGRQFRTLREAERFTGIDQSSINKVLRGFRQTAGGLTWKYMG